MNKKRYLLKRVAGAVTICLWICAHAEARIWHVSTEELPGIDWTPSIAEAVQNVQPGDKILIHAGVYYEISYGLHAHDNVIVSNGLADTSSAWGANAGISISSSPNCIIQRNLIIGNKEGFTFRDQERSTPRINDRTSEPIWNHDSTVRNNVITYNRDAQTWGWFDISDDRHWPAQDKDTEALSLEKLALTFKDNLYYTDVGQGLFNWGVTWKKCRRYSTLEQVRAELGLESGSTSAPT